MIIEHIKKLWYDECVPGYTCALQKDILYQGRLFVSENWICFHSKVFGKDTKVEPENWWETNLE